MSATGQDEDASKRNQQPMLARHRAKEAGQEGTQTPKSGYFPLGMKEGFNQWVRTPRARQSDNH